VVVANLSARVSSIGDNRLGGWHSYRASKSALNMLTKNVAIEFARKQHPVTCILLHPGTVSTELSLPFQKNGAPENVPLRKMRKKIRETASGTGVRGCMFRGRVRLRGRLQPKLAEQAYYLHRRHHHHHHHLVPILNEKCVVFCQRVHPTLKEDVVFLHKDVEFSLTIYQ
jgi:NAD(P)-dependent dehydrogenase (short-subunit alcohol dehydrogenase family)